jgi:hypothetical protein
MRLINYNLYSFSVINTFGDNGIDDLHFRRTWNLPIKTISNNVTFTDHNQTDFIETLLL